MKILMINKFLYPKGGAETYVLKIGEYLQTHGHEVQYFGMDGKDRTVGNQANAYTSEMDFHGGSMLSKVTYPVKTVYSAETRRKIRKVLDSFQPDVCHLNNFNYQLTPSAIVEIAKWRKETGHPCRIIYTAHDSQLVCPNHMLYNPNTHETCEKCMSGRYVNCIKGKCIHGSRAKSIVGAAEAAFWRRHRAYREIDAIICCSKALKIKLDTNPVFAQKTIAIHNFVDKIQWCPTEKKDYVLYFGRFSVEKGIEALLKACRALPDIPFIFAGSGPLEDQIKGIQNVKNVGFQKGGALERLIREARFTVIPSVWFENCPFSVLESLMYGTPVLGAITGGIPELIQEGKTGELFETGNWEELKTKLEKLWNDPALTARYAENCKDIRFDDIDAYCKKLIRIYEGQKDLNTMRSEFGV